MKITSKRLAWQVFTRYRGLIGSLVLLGLTPHLTAAQAEEVISEACIQKGQESPAAVFQVVDQQGEVSFCLDQRSGPSEQKLAQHLTDIGAAIYTAFWCPFCHEQLGLFGVEAIATLNVIECDAEGQNPQTALCKETFMRYQAETGERARYPTWEIQGQFYTGVHSLAELAEISGYDGPQDFLPPPELDESADALTE